MAYCNIMFSSDYLVSEFGFECTETEIINNKIVETYSQSSLVDGDLAVLLVYKKMKHRNQTNEIIAHFPLYDSANPQVFTSDTDYSSPKNAPALKALLCYLSNCELI